MIALYLLIAAILSTIGTHPADTYCAQKRPLYIASNGIHLYFILPREELGADLADHLAVPATTAFVSFGWGDRKFYLETPTWGQFRLRVALRALFLKSEPAMHITHYDRLSGNWQRLAVCEAQYAQLQVFLWGSFRKNGQGRLLELEASGYTSRDKFYQANGSYSLLKTCNNWVNTGLKQAAVKTSVWSPFVHGVLYHLERNAEEGPQ